MKNKYDAKKNNRYNGYNLFGQCCEGKTVKMERENAFNQYLDVLNAVEAAKAEGRRVEYTLEWLGFQQEEIDRVFQQIKRVMALRNYLRGVV